MSDADAPLEFVGSSKEDLSALPAPVKSIFGFALRTAQKGGKHPDAKPLKGFGGAGVLEMTEDFDGDTYRAVYTVKFKGMIYVLHAFQKKSKTGIATATLDIRKIQSRLKTAEILYNARMQEKARAKKNQTQPVDPQQRQRVRRHRRT
jgi:phage-related protein